MVKVTAGQVSQMLGVSVSTVLRLERDGVLPAAERFGPGRRRRWDLDEMLAFTVSAAKGDGRRFRRAPLAVPGG